MRILAYSESKLRSRNKRNIFFKAVNFINAFRTEVSEIRQCGQHYRTARIKIYLNPA